MSTPRLRALVILVLILWGCSAQTTRPDSAWRIQWRVRFNEGKSAHANGDMKTAEREFLAAREIARAEEPPGLGTALSLNALAAIWINEGRIREGAAAIAEATPIFESRLGKANEHYAMLLTNRGDLAVKERRYSDGEADFREALRITEQIVPVPANARARAGRMLTASLCFQGRQSEADEIGREFNVKCR